MSDLSPANALTQFRQAQARRFADATLLGLQGVSPAMVRVRAQVAAAIASGASVLILGRDAEQITEIAHAIHYRRHPEGEAVLQAMDAAAALPTELPRAVQTLLRSTSGGTLLIESVEQLPTEQQFALLTAMGHEGWHAQIIATSADADWHGSNRVSDELAAMLSTLTIEVPPLADRSEDIPALAEATLKELNAETEGDVVSKIADDALEQLMLHNWPGELTELRQVVTAARRRARHAWIAASDLPPVIHHAVEHAAHRPERPKPIDLDAYLGRVETALVERALELANQNKAEAARLLGVSRPRLYRKLEQMGVLEPAAPRPRPVPTPMPAQIAPPAEPTPADDGIEFLPLDSDE